MYPVFLLYLRYVATVLIHYFEPLAQNHGLISTSTLNVPLLRALLSPLDGIWGILKGSWRCLKVYSIVATFIISDLAVSVRLDLGDERQVRCKCASADI